MRCSRVRRFLSEYPAFDLQLSTFNLPARGVPPPDSRPQSIQTFALTTFLDKNRIHVVICYLILSDHFRRTAPQAAPLRNLCVLRVSALDFSSLGLTLNLQLSTFNRVSFLSPSSPHLCALGVLCGENSSSFRSSLIPRHSPLTSKSFTIRTSETPLPQLLSHPHFQAPLTS